MDKQMPRVTIGQLMIETGLSRSTVDRVLNRRGPVHDRTRQIVEEALNRLSQAGAGHATLEADIVVTLGRGVTAQLQAAWNAQAVTGRFHDLAFAPDADLCDIIAEHCRMIDRPLMLAIREVPKVSEILSAARQRGKRVVTVMTDLGAEARDAFIGIDDRAAGQTAAFLIGQFRHAAPIGVLLGNPAIKSHTDREIGFRWGFLNAMGQEARLIAALGGTSSITTREAVEQMLTDTPTLGALYHIGPGSAGVVEAVRRLDLPVMVIGHEINAVTAPLIADGGIQFALASDPALLLETAIAILSGRNRQAAEMTLLDFGIYTRTNLPSYSQLV